MSNEPMQSECCREDVLAWEPCAPFQELQMERDEARAQLANMTKTLEEENIARILARLDGFNPDATGDYSVKVIREGKMTDTGHDTRRGTTETVTAGPAWTAYTFKARKLIAALKESESK